jgi:hypothetical protein
LDDLPVLDDAFAAHLDDIIFAPSLLPPAPGVSIQQLLGTAPWLMQCVLLGCDDWKEWNAAEHAQLDAHHAHQTFGKPMIWPQICCTLRAIWNYVIKWTGERKACICCDGRPLRLRGSNLVQANYTVFISQMV